MLRPVTTSSASASSAPVAVHASAAAEFSANEARASAAAVKPVAGQQTGSVNAEQIFRYNSFEFVYRQDIGRIVLIGQSPETGERVVQVPSEQALRVYEHAARVERQLRRSQPSLPSAPAPSPSPQSSSGLAKALVAAVGGDNHGSGVVSVSA
ncbi:MAG TPA: hypothetical protein VFG64_15430 [Dongiaceae bacterium]|nr:hypothetical protein [Dongiaceae bacterium]